MMSKTTKACVGVQSIEYKRQGPLPVDFTKKKNWFLQLCCFKQATRAVFLGYTPLLCLVELQLETGAKKIGLVFWAISDRKNGFTAFC